MESFFQKAVHGEKQEFMATGYGKDGKYVDIHVTFIPHQMNTVYVILKKIANSSGHDNEVPCNEIDSVCSFYYDAKNNRYSFSMQLQHMFGAVFSPSHQQFLQWVHPDDRPFVDNMVQEALENKSGYRIEYRILQKDGQIRYLYEQAEVFHRENGFADGLIGFFQDITDKKMANVPSTRRVIDSDQFYRALFENNLNMVFYLDQLGIIAKTNEKVSEALGYANEDILLHSIEKLLPVNESPLFHDFLHRILSGEKLSRDTVFLDKHGQPLPIRLEGIPALADGNVIGIFLVAEDISKEKTMEGQLNDAELKYKSLIEQAFIGVFILEKGGAISYANQKFYQILGLEPDSSLNIWHHIHPDDYQSQKRIWQYLMDGEEGIEHAFRMRRQDNTIIDIEAHSKKVVLENNHTVVIGVIQDVTERKKAEDLNRYLAYHDPLTDLPNRRYFHEKLTQAISARQSSEQKLAVLYIDLDRFKYINDTLGHLTGDELLKSVTIRLKGVLRDGDTLARLGGDEFALMISEMSDTKQVIDFTENVIKMIEKPFHIQGYELYITASIGISLFPTDGEDVETIIKHADSALYKAKDHGKNTYHMYTPSMDEEAYDFFTLQSDLHKAIEEEQFELYYQPKICTATYQIIGAEALIRWRHPEQGMISPGKFIPVAEETGLILAIGKWTKIAACRQIKAWKDDGLPIVPVSINLSAQHFLDKDLLTNLRKALDEAKIEPAFLEVEITEGSLLENEKVVRTILASLREMGIGISLDDFGTGYSSLSYLKRFKGMIDILKIDKSFINDLRKTKQEDANAITKIIIELAQQLEMDVVAEGVETLEQQEILKEFRCNTIQGYLFSKPLPAEEFAALLRSGKILPPKEEAVFRGS